MPEAGLVRSSLSQATGRLSSSLTVLRRLGVSRRSTSVALLVFCLVSLVFLGRTADGFGDRWRALVSPQQVEVVELEEAVPPPAPAPAPPDPALPPLYQSFHQAELGFPQHDPSLPFPEGKTGRYIFIANHAVGNGAASGWANIMQEIILNALLAHESRRAFVFDNFTWNTNGEDYATFNNHLIPSRIPFNTIMTGPAVGAAWPADDPAPRSVLKEYYDRVCPPDERTFINSSDVVPWVSDMSAQGVLDQWVARLNQTEARCAEVDRNSNSLQIFNIYIFGSAKRLLPIWPLLRSSPILRSFGWSDLILSGFTANRNLFDPRYPAPDVSKSVIDGLLAIHVRRGDFEGHCPFLADTHWDFNGFSAFPEFLDPFMPPPADMEKDAARDFYRPRCYPSMEEIVDKVEDVRSAHAELRAVYVMTNAPKVWADELVAALKAAHPWELAASSRDMKLNHEQRYVAQAPDMVIGQRAQVFIGNGFSSLTSNIIMLRMFDQKPPESNRLW